MSRSTAIAVACTLPAGFLLAVITHGVLHTGADTLDPAAVAVGFTATVAVVGSAGWHGTKAVVEMHAETVRRSRHRRAPSATLPLRQRTAQQLADSLTDEKLEALTAQFAEAVATGKAEWIPPVVPAGLDRRQTFDTTAADWPTPPAVDPYLTPGAVDADGYPAPDPETRIDLQADLYAHDQTPEVSDDTAVLDLEARLRTWSAATP